jgi:hypothetical protein
MSTAAIRRAIAASIAAGLLTLAAIASTAGASGADAGLAGLELARVQQANCQVLLAGATSSGQRNRANACIADQQVIIDRLTAASASPSSSPSATQAPSSSPSTSTPQSPSPSPTSSLVPTSSSPVPTPSPTLTGPPALQTNCWAQLAACGYPDRATTGRHLTGGFAATTSGDLHIFTAGTVIDNRLHTGAIYVHAANVTIRNSVINLTSTVPWGINTEAVPASGPTIIVDTDVTCAAGQAHGVGAITGPNFRATRIWSVNCENALEMGNNSQVVDSYLRGSENGPGDPHGDGIQAQSGSNIVIRHNTLLQGNPMTSAIITNPTLNSHWLVENNIMGGGAYTFYCPEDPAQGDFVVRNNRFYPYKNATGQKLYELGDNHAPAYGQTDECSDSRITWTGNIDEYLRTVPAGGLN